MTIEYPREIDGHVEVVMRWRLFSDTPPEDRMTPESIKEQVKGRYSEDYIAQHVQALIDPQCKVGVLHTSYPTGWAPCKGNTYEGSDLCPTHGGPPGQRARTRGMTKSQLRAEVERLQAELRGVTR